MKESIKIEPKQKQLGLRRSVFRRSVRFGFADASLSCDSSFFLLRCILLINRDENIVQPSCFLEQISMRQNLFFYIT